MTHDLGNVAIVGATGAVGREALSILESRQHPAEMIVPLASARSAGTHISYAGDSLLVRAIDAEAFNRTDFALFCATAEVSRRWAHPAGRAGAVVIDNSSAFRLHDDVPLVVPEVNGEAIPPGCTLIANPNCSTIILLVALNPLRARFGIERIVVSTYQAVSGAGAAALSELREQAAAVLASGSVKPKVFHEPCAFNVFSHNSRVELDTGVNGEERKMIDESRKIWADPSLSITPTCVRVPVFRAHTESVTVTLSEPATESQVRAALSAGSGLRVVDDRATNSFPTTLHASEHDEVLVGRIRPDPSEVLGPDGNLQTLSPPDSHRVARTWCLLIAGDQIRKGAALNAIQIADLVAARQRQNAQIAPS